MSICAHVSGCLNNMHIYVYAYSFAQHSFCPFSHIWEISKIRGTLSDFWVVCWTFVPLSPFWWYPEPFGLLEPPGRLTIQSQSVFLVFSFFRPKALPLPCLDPWNPGPPPQTCLDALNALHPPFLNSGRHGRAGSWTATILDPLNPPCPTQILDLPALLLLQQHAACFHVVHILPRNVLDSHAPTLPPLLNSFC